MDSSLKSALQRMGSNFLVAAFVPAMAFTFAAAIVFYPLLPADTFPSLNENLSEFIQINFVLLLFVTILGFTLYSLSTYIYKSFEGYTFILGMKTGLRHSFLRRQEKRFKKLEADLMMVEKRLSRINQKIEQESQNTKTGARYAARLDRYAKEQKSLYTRRYNLTSEREGAFPHSLDLILPTRFGNILRAAEMYPGVRYSIDAVPLWGRLSHVIPEDRMEKIDDANNQCLFLLNAALLTAIFTTLCLLASTYQGLTWWAATNHTQLLQSIVIDSKPYIYQERMWIYVGFGVLSSVIAWFFYEASLLNVSQFGDMIRASYDLYRFNLLEALHLELPTTLQAERAIWRRLSYFMMGNDQRAELEGLETLEKYSDHGIGFNYLHPKEQKKQSTPKPVGKK